MSPASRPLIVVPTYNEVGNIDSLLEGIRQHAPGASVLFVDDSSADGTLERIHAWQKRAPDEIHLLQRPRKLGLGTAYVAGFRQALELGFTAAIQMDADLSHDPADLARLLRLLEEHPVVVGSRYVEGGSTPNWTLGRRLVSRFGNVYARAVLGLAVQDLTSGFNAWRREVLEAVSLDRLRSDGYAFQIEMKCLASRAGFRLHEMPIVFVDRRVGHSKMSWAVFFEGVIRAWTLRLGGDS
jgi:dolichol-phosphate mannosyltransferase